MLVCTVTVCTVFATPWAAPFRRELRPELPIIVILLAAISAVAQLVIGTVQLFSRSAWRRAAALPFSLGASALCMALAFLSRTRYDPPRLVPLIGAAVFAVTAAALHRRARERSEL